jgi:dTDP-4-amino-4,6-dideoxygalactose transaminase
MTDVAASLGIHQLKRAHIFQQRRAYLASLYDQALVDLPLVLPPHAADGDLHAWHIYVVQLADSTSIERDTFIEHLFNQGIGCSVHYIPLHLHPYWRETYSLTPEMFPASQAIYERSVSLPLYTRMTEFDVTRVANAVRQLLG